MSDFINKVVTIILAFVMLVLAPINISYMMTELTSQRVVLNEVTQFLDKVSDKGSATQEDLDNLYLGIAASGGFFDVEVVRFIRVSSLDENNAPKTLYFSSNQLSALSSGDIVRVTVREVGISPAKRLTWALLRVDRGKFEFSLAASIR